MLFFCSCPDEIHFDLPVATDSVARTIYEDLSSCPGQVKIVGDK